MKNVLIALTILTALLTTSIAEARGGSVRGYYRSNGTYVRPYYRSAPDGVRWNNYGRAGYGQRQEYKSYSTVPSYNNDYDGDGILNRYDHDDDNNGIADDFDK